jgi:hypothetical protein
VRHQVGPVIGPFNDSQCVRLVLLKRIGDERTHPSGLTVIVNQFGVDAPGDQLCDQCDVAGARGEHLRSKEPPR